MEIYEKIKKMRLLKGWSQEQFAEKLNLSVNGYAKIERGERDMNLTRLQQIAETLDVKLIDLLGWNEKNLFTNVVVVNGSNNFAQNNIILNEYGHELEKARLLLIEREKEIHYLKKENERLQEIINLLQANK